MRLQSASLYQVLLCFVLFQANPHCSLATKAHRMDCKNILKNPPCVHLSTRCAFAATVTNDRSLTVGPSQIFSSAFGGRRRAPLIERRQLTRWKTLIKEPFLVCLNSRATNNRADVSSAARCNSVCVSQTVCRRRRPCEVRLACAACVFNIGAQLGLPSWAKHSMTLESDRHRATKQGTSFLTRSVH